MPNKNSGLRVGTAERDSTFLSQGLALKTVLERNPALAPVEVSLSTHASIENANRLEAGEIDVGFMAANWIGPAKNAEPPFARGIDLRMVAPMNAGPLFFVTRAASPLLSVRDLRGRRVVVGPRLSGMAQHARVILGSLGLNFADITPVYLDFAAGAEALIRCEVAAQLQCPIPNKVMTSLAERIAVRVLPFAPGDLDEVLRAVPFYRPTVMHAGAIRGLEADVAQPAVLNVLVSHTRVAADKIKDVTAAILAAREELPRLEPLFAGVAELFEPLRQQGAAALEFGGVPLHDGAIEAYRAADFLK